MAPENGPHPCYHETMSARRGWREDGIFFEHDAPCRDSDRHRHCHGRWRGAISLGYGPDGKRIRRKVSGKTKAIVQDRLKALHGDLETGLRAQPELHGPARRRRLADRRARRPVGQDGQEERERPGPDPGHDRRPATARTDRRRRAPGADDDGPALLQRRRGHGPQRADPGDPARRGPGPGRAATSPCSSRPRRARPGGRARA